jgi:phosphotriesterase-related protein
VTRHIKQQGRLAQVLVSHDAGWYRVGEPGGGRFRPFDTLFTTFVPALEKAGFSAADVRQLLVVNPANALQPRLPG